MVPTVKCNGYTYETLLDLNSPEADNESNLRKYILQLFFSGFIWNVPD